MKLTNSMLKNISKQIECGRGITAIAIANHYLKKDCPLRLALVKKANLNIKSSNTLSIRVLKGEVVENEQLMQLASENKNSSSRKLIVPSDFSLQYKRCTDLRRKMRSLPSRSSYTISPAIPAPFLAQSAPRKLWLAPKIVQSGLCFDLD